MQSSNTCTPRTWGTKTVEKLFYVKGRIGWRGLKRADFTESGPYLITGMHFNEDGSIDWESCFHIPENKYLESPEIIVQSGDIVITKDGTIGKVSYIDHLPGPASLNSHLFLVRNSSNTIETRFAYHVFRSELFRDFIGKQQLGSTRGGLPESRFLKFVLPFPPLPEQRRIAAILDAADEALRAAERVIANLRRIKAGLLHDLLTRGLDAQGCLRDPVAHPGQFKDSPLGRIPLEWEIGGIDDLAINHDGKRIPLKQDDRAKRQGKYPYYGASGVIDWIDQYIFDGDFVLLGEDGANIVTRQLPLAFIVKGKFWANNHAHVYEPLSGVNIRFFVELLESTDYSIVVSGSAQPKLTQAAMDHLHFRIPPSAEQTRIAAILDAHDARIRAEEATLAKLRQVKRGLMDDLLTGRVRCHSETPLHAAEQPTLARRVEESRSWSALYIRKT